MRSPTSTKGLVVGLILGVPVMAYGARGVFVDADDTHPAELGRWIVGLAVVNDFVVIPLAIALAFGLRWVLPGWAWPSVRAGLLGSAVLAFIAWPLIRGYGDDPANPSLFPRSYGAGLLVALAVVWVSVLVGSSVARHVSSAGDASVGERRGGGAGRRGLRRR
jgi:hypothetical protein